jgi:hypothetical protein
MCVVISLAVVALPLTLKTDWSGVQPIASGTWNPSRDAASQNEWRLRVGSAVGRKNIFQSGNSNSLPPQWGAATLIATENATVRDYVKTYSHHNYPGGSITGLMSHSGIVRNLNQFTSDVASALAIGKPYVFGETNSGECCRGLYIGLLCLCSLVSGGGAANVSPSFGAALWTMDYVVYATYKNISRTYFHHGTVGNCQYCFWGRYSMGAPYYGATAATAFLAKGAYLTQLDDGSSAYGGYVTYDADRNPLRALLYNSNYFSGSGSRSSHQFVLTGLAGSSVRTKRLTAPSAESRVDRGASITFGNQYYGNGTCVVDGQETFEVANVSSGQATFTLQASEALVVYF